MQEKYAYIIPNLENIWSSGTAIVSHFSNAHQKERTEQKGKKR
jgi:hypothetical protein